MKNDEPMVSIPRSALIEMEAELRMLKHENHNYAELLKYIYQKNDDNIQMYLDYNHKDNFLSRLLIDIDVVDSITGTNLRQEANFRKRKEEPTEADSSRK